MLSSLSNLFGDDALTQSIVSCCARLKTSKLFEDQLSALNELETLSKEHPLEVGIKSLSLICDDILSKYADGSDSEPILTKKCVDILMLLVLPPEEPFDNNLLPRHPSTNRVYYECNLDLLFDAKSKSGDRMDVFIKLLKDDFSEYNPDNIIIELQYNIVQILTFILLYDNTAHKLRSELLRSACGAMNTLSELLNSPHEFIRNACVILLSHLSLNDPSIQKLIGMPLHIFVHCPHSDYPFSI